MSAPRENLTLVVGGGGFIGSHVVRQLVESGRSVRVFGRSSLRAHENLDGVRTVEIVYGDVANHGEVEAALESVREVVYLVHTTVPASSMRDLTFDLETNIPPVIHLAKMVGSLGTVQRLVFLSSGGTVYGESGGAEPIEETHPLVPISSYGLTKMVAEHYLRLCLDGSRVVVHVLRPSNVYGPRQNLDRPQGAVGHFLKALALGASISLYGDGSTVRDYLHAEDLARAVLLCLEDRTSEPGKLQTFNVGSGVGVSLHELVQVIEEVVGRKLSVREEPERGFDCRFNVLSWERIGRRLGWRPMTPLREGILETWRWVEESLK